MGKFEQLEGRNLIMVGVPLHKMRQKWRGFNQADELGKRLAKAWGWRYEKQVVERVKKAKNQMGLTRSERLVNVKGIFGVGRNIGRVKGEKVLLVDDVWTTGATMRECAEVLKRNGASEVWGLVVAR